MSSNRVKSLLIEGALRLRVDLRSVKRRLRTARASRQTLQAAPPTWYDDFYGANPAALTCHYSESSYYFLWKELVARIPGDSSVLEIGCGTGQLAEMLLDNGLKEYCGFDFSEAAVNIARKRLVAPDFQVADALTTSLLSDYSYTLVICTEVLEHIEGDLAVIGRIKPATRVLATVPDFYAASHVRWFNNVEAVAERYAPLFTEFSVTAHHRPEVGGTLFLIDAVR